MTDAEKRDRVIRALEWCIKLDGKGCPLECPYLAGKKPCPSVMLRDALALLKEQEARVMTLEEVEKTDEWMWAEYVSGYCGWQRPDEEDDYLNMIAWNDSTVDRKDYYGKTWRCWTARPTEEQMRDTPWEGEKDA